MYTLTKLPYAFDGGAVHRRPHGGNPPHEAPASLRQQPERRAKEYPQLQGLPVTQLIADLNRVPEAIRLAVRNNGGGVANHSCTSP